MDDIKIGPIRFGVVKVVKLLDEEDSVKLDGCVTYSDSLIKVDSKLGEQKARQVVWHEIVHVLLRQGSVEVPDVERLCEVLSYGIMQVLDDNEWT